MDHDGIPDSCDSCPYWFNPRQNVTDLCMVDGVCPNEFVEKVVWSATESGQVDRQLCPEPLTGRITYTHTLIDTSIPNIGIATRLCNTNGEWDDPNFTNCTSSVGQRVTIIVSSFLCLLSVCHPSIYSSIHPLINYFSIA